GRIGQKVSETMRFELAHRLIPRPAVVFHAIDRRHHAGAMQPSLAVDEHGMHALIVHDLEKFLDGGWRFPGMPCARQKLDEEESIVDAEALAQGAFADERAIESAGSQI